MNLSLYGLYRIADQIQEMEDRGNLPQATGATSTIGDHLLSTGFIDPF